MKFFNVHIAGSWPLEAWPGVGPAPLLPILVIGTMFPGEVAEFSGAALAAIWISCSENLRRGLGRPVEAPGRYG